MLRTGLVSITFRKLQPREIVELVARAGLVGIEWGGDVHVPHGDTARAREVARMTEDAGLKVASYGSYYRVGAADAGPFEPVLACAVELSAPTVRVWAGRKGSQEATGEYRQHVVAESRRIADLTAAEGIAVAYEFHNGTLTDTNDSAVALLRDVGHENVRTYWQAPGGRTFEYRLAGLEAVLPWLSNIHCGHRAETARRPLAEASEQWWEYLARAARTGREHFVMLEFVGDDSPENFFTDAAELKRLLAGAQNA